MENERFQSSNRGLLCSFRNQCNYILSFVSKLALVLLLNTYKRFHGCNRNVFCSLWNPFFVFKKSIKICTSVVIEYLCSVSGWYPKCVMQSSEPILCIQKSIKSIELVRRSGFRSGYGSDTSVVIEYL